MLITLHPANDGDELFLYQVYASTRAEEMDLVNWNAEQKQAFLQMQFTAQREHYRLHYPAAEYSVIWRDRDCAGRLIVDRSADKILLMDIALLPEYRNAGIGTGLVRGLQDEASQTGRPLRLHVEFFNRALKLYERMGFRQVDELGVYYEMEWRPGGAGDASTGAQQGRQGDLETRGQGEGVRG
jgi:GNAT superfamily N-acetyltransferase